MTGGSYIRGAWVAGGEEMVRKTSPSDIADLVGQFERADAALAEDAIAAAAEAFPAWSHSGIPKRAAALEKIGSELMARSAELGTLLSREEGKTRREAVAEVVRAGQIFRFFAGATLRPTGQLVDSLQSGVRVEITREPLGPVGIITPWNFPLALPAWKIGAALAYGNTVVFKPADLVPATSSALAGVIAGSGLPAGVFNFVRGRGSVVGEALTAAPNIAGISFTGSGAVGQPAAVRCAERGARVQLELGGKNPLVVLDDADISRAVDCAVEGAFFSTGQRCTASSRLLVTAGIHDEFVERLIERTRQLSVGHSLADQTQIGPVVDEAQLATDLEYVSIARQEGAEVAFGGERLERQHDGYYFEPAILIGATNAMRSSREEIFGPVASVIKVGNYDEALAVANDTDYGLTAGIVTRSLSHAQHFQRNVQAGIVAVNRPTAGLDYHVPLSGRKASSYGPPEQGDYAREFFTAVKTSYVRR